MDSKPQDLSLACSFLFSLLLLFPFLTSPPPPLPPLLDDHEQLPSRTRTRRLDDGDYDDDDNRRRPKKKRRVGDHFNPDNDELMDHYLKKKIQGIDVQQLHQGIAEVDILNYEPQQLPERSAVKTEKWYWYFFYRLENYGKRPSSGEFGKITRKLKSGKGTWKPTGKEHQVLSEKTNQRIGTTKCLTYFPSSKPKAKGNHSEWTMHEYHLLPDVPNPEQYVIVKLIKKGGMPANLSPAKNGEVINLPEEVNMDLASSSDAPGCQYPLLPTSPVNEISTHSFGMPNAEQVCNHHDPNQNGHMEEQLSFQPMISIPTDEHTQEDTSSWVNEYDQYGMDRFCQQMSTPSFVMNSPPTELGGSIYGYQRIQSIPLDQELQVPHCDTNFNIDLSPITQADLDEFFGLNDYEPSPQSIHLDQELQEFLMNDSYTDGSIDPIPLIQAELDQNFDFISEGSEDDAAFKRLCDELCIKSSDLQSVVGNTPSPQSPNFFELNMLPSQGCVTLLKSPQLNHNI